MIAILPTAAGHPHYSRVSIALHWLMLVLLAAVYACIELREYYPRGSDIREGLKTWHFMLGLSVFVLVWVRLVARWRTPLLAPEPGWTRWPAAAGHLALYGLMIIMPILGWTALSADGKEIPFFACCHKSCASFFIDYTFSRDRFCIFVYTQRTSS